MLDFLALAQQCSPAVHQDTMRRIAHVESSFNPYAIGVVGGRLDRQPRNISEAIATANWLQSNGYNFSVGLVQVNKHNFSKYGLTLQTAFDPCANLRAGGGILTDCYQRAMRSRSNEQAALRDAFSCYYSGNFLTGYREGYVLKVVSANAPTVPMVKVEQGRPGPAVQITPLNSSPAKRPPARRLPPGEQGALLEAATESTNSALLF